MWDMKSKWMIFILALAGISCAGTLSLEESLAPYSGPVESNTNHSTLHGTVMCGYQGWFTHQDDGGGTGNFHWGDVTRNPPRCSVDLWPDMLELAPEEKFPTNYRHADGSTAYVFSSTVKPTVLRHFKWMQDYGIDGVWVQRFASQINAPRRLRMTNTVLSHCREGANRYGRSFAVMYDTAFNQKTCDLMKKDWNELLGKMEILESPAYQHHRGRPVIGLWGYGFRSFDEAACEAFLRFLKSEEGGGCTILAGVPNDWRRWENGNDQERAQFRLLRKYIDIVQPWNVGRYGSPEGAETHFAHYFPDDIKWCADNDKDYYAVIFPGFSWTNLRHGHSPLNQTPRLGGRFLWRQAKLVDKYHLDMVYIAMFDEVDEGTAIFKCTNHPPIGRFVTYEGYPSDHYLRLSGLIGKMMQGKSVSFPHTRPERKEMKYKPLSTDEYYKDTYP